MVYKRTYEIRDIDWNVVFSAYEKLHDARIDGAVPQAWYDEHAKEIGRRMGACWVYDSKSVLGHPMFRDEVLRDIGVYLGWEEE